MHNLERVTENANNALAASCSFNNDKAPLFEIRIHSKVVRVQAGILTFFAFPYTPHSKSFK